MSKIKGSQIQFADEAGPVKGSEIQFDDSPKQKEAGVLDSIGDAASYVGKKGVDAASWVFDKLDRYVDAPSRSAVGAMQKDSNPLEAAANQFGEDPEKAPTWKDILMTAGVSGEPVYSQQDLEQMGNGGTPTSIGQAIMQEGAKKRAQNYDPEQIASPAGMAAVPVSMVASPSSYIPGGLGVLGKAAKLEKAVPAISKGIKSVSEPVADYLQTLANKRAFKALGPYQRDVLKSSPDEIQKIGREALDSGLVSGMPKSKETLAHEAETLANQRGEQIGSMIDEMAELEPKVINGMGSDAAVAVPDAPSGGTIGIKRSSVVKSLRDDLIDMSELGNIAPEENELFHKMISAFEGGGDNYIPIKDAQQLKQSIGKKINWNRRPMDDIPSKEQFWRALYSKVSQGIEDEAVALEKLVRGPSAKDYVNAKEKYGALKTARNIAQNRADKEFANRTLGLTDYMTSGAAASVGAKIGGAMAGPPGAVFGAGAGGVLGGAANKLGRTYGSQVMAKGLHSGASGVRSVSSSMDKLIELARSNPELLKTLKNPAVISGIQKMSQGAEAALQTAENPGGSKSFSSQSPEPIEESQRKFIGGE